MHVLVIGGSRFVGRFLVWRLVAGGHRVTLLNRGRIADPFGDRVERLVGDRTAPDLERLLAGRSFDAVVDLAAYTGEDGRRIAALLRGRTGHYVMVSTGQVYLVREGCQRPAREPAREECYDGPVMARPADPADIEDWEYGIGKRDCENALIAAAQEGFPATRVRIPMANGPLDYFRRIEGYLWRLVDGGPVILPDGGGHRPRSWRCPRIGSARRAFAPSTCPRSTTAGCRTSTPAWRGTSSASATRRSRRPSRRSPRASLPTPRRIDPLGTRGATPSGGLLAERSFHARTWTDKDRPGTQRQTSATSSRCRSGSAAAWMK